MELSAVPPGGAGGGGDSPPHTVLRTRAASSSSLLRGGKVAAGGGEFPGPGARWGGRYLRREVSRKGEALAVAGLAQYGSSLELIAPVEVLKELFKLPYTQQHAPLAIVIHRVGATLVLSPGSELDSEGPVPGSEAAKELGSSLVSRLLCHPGISSTKGGSSSSSGSPSDSNNSAGDGRGPPSQKSEAAQGRPSLQRLLASGEEEIDERTACQEGLVFGTFDSSTLPHSHAAHAVTLSPTPTPTPIRSQGRHGDSARGEWPAGASKRPSVPLHEARPSCGAGRDGAGAPHAFQAGLAEPLGERVGGSVEGGREGGGGGREERVEMQGGEEEEKDEGAEEEGGAGEYPFARVVLWHFGPSWRMLLGSDLVVFSNKDHSAVSLHLVELRLEASPLLWLDIWLENVMAGISEVAICYHCDETVHGYELLRTDDISQIKALTRDGSPSFQPAVVERCASLVLDFLRDNCTRTPGTYLLSKRSGDGVLQLHDLTQPARGRRGGGLSRELAHTRPPAPAARGRSATLPLSLAMIMYRLAQKLSRRRPQAPSDQHRSAALFLQALQFLDHHSHPGVCAAAHEFIADHCLRYTCALGAPVSSLLEGPQGPPEGTGTVSMHQEDPMEAVAAPLAPAEQLLAGSEGGEVQSALKATAGMLEDPPAALSARAGTGPTSPQARPQSSLSKRSAAPLRASIPVLSLDRRRVTASIPGLAHPALAPLLTRHMVMQPDGSAAGVRRQCNRTGGKRDLGSGAALAGEEACVAVGATGPEPEGGSGAHSGAEPEGGSGVGTDLGLGGEQAGGAVKAVEACLAAVEHASRAIEALQAKRRLLQTPLEWRSPFPSPNLLATLATSAAAGECLCGEPDCHPLALPGADPQAPGAGEPNGRTPGGRSRMASRPSGAGGRGGDGAEGDTLGGKQKARVLGQEEQQEARVCALVVMLAESYLELGRALAREGDKSRALRATEIVCLLLGALPLPQEEEGAQGLALPQAGVGPAPAATKRATQGPSKGLKTPGRAPRPVEVAAGPAVERGAAAGAEERLSRAKAARLSRAHRLVSRSGKSFLGQAWLLAGEMFVEAAKKGGRAAGAQAGMATHGLGHRPGQSPAGEVRAHATCEDTSDRQWQADGTQGRVKVGSAVTQRLAAPMQGAMGRMGGLVPPCAEQDLRVYGHVVEEVQRARKRNHGHMRSVSPSSSATSSAAGDGQKGHLDAPAFPSTCSTGEASSGISRALPGRQRRRGKSKSAKGPGVGAAESEEWEVADECFACSAARCSCLSDRVASGMSASTSSPRGPRGLPSSSATSSTTSSSSSRSRGADGVMSGNAGGSTLPSSRKHSKRGSHRPVVAPPQASAPVHAPTPATTAPAPSTSSERCFGHPISADPLSGLAAAAHLFTRAADAFSSVGDSASAGDALRKEGWCSNELGRALAASCAEPEIWDRGRGGAQAGTGAAGPGEGALSAEMGRDAGEWFLRASAAFKRAGDTANAVLSLCNLGHAKRAAAERLVAQLGHAELTGVSRTHPQGTSPGHDTSGDPPSHPRAAAGAATSKEDRHQGNGRSVWKEQELVAFAARCAYAGALEWYGEATAELLRAGEGAAQHLAGPWQEAHKQLAHTYLRLGGFLAKFGDTKTDDKYREASSQGSRGGAVGQGLEGPPLEGGPLTAGEALAKAILLYEFLGQACAQQAAYAHYQLGLVLHKEALGKVGKGEAACAAGGRAPGLGSKKRDGLALAREHFERATDFYSGEAAYLNMFVDICVERARLEQNMQGAPDQEQTTGALWHILVALKRLMPQQGRRSEEKLSGEKHLEQEEEVREGAKLHQATCEALQTALQEFLRNALTRTMRAGGESKQVRQSCSSSSSLSVAQENKGQTQANDPNQMQIMQVRRAYKLSLCGSLDKREELEELVEALEHVVH